MIVTDCNIQVNDDRSTADKNIIVYRGDYNVQVTFTITHINDYRYRGTDSGENLIESTNASYGQILIKNQDGESVFVISEIEPTNEGKVTLTILGEYINELVELGAYDYQIRLFSAEKEARLTIPPVEGQLIVKEPLIFGDQIDGSKVGIAQVNHAIILTAEEDVPTFDDAGSYNKTQWTNGDIITDGKLNKIEDALAVLTDESKTHATTNYVDESIETIELTPGPKGDKGDQGEQGIQGVQGVQGPAGAAFTYDMFTEEQLEALRGPAGETGPKGEKGDTPSLDGYATEQYVDDTINQLGEAINTALESGEFLKEVQLSYNKETVLVDNLQLTQSAINLNSAGFIIGDYPNVYYRLTLHMDGESQSTLGQVVTQDDITFVVFLEGAIQIYIGVAISDAGEIVSDPSKAVLIFYNAEIPEGMSVSLTVFGPQPYVTQDVLSKYYTEFYDFRDLYDWYYIVEGAQKAHALETQLGDLSDYATKEEVNDVIGDINTVLDVINGEIIPDNTDEVNALLDSINGEVI